jgi:hypothetical protein
MLVLGGDGSAAGGRRPQCRVLRHEISLVAGSIGRLHEPINVLAECWYMMISGARTLDHDVE